MRREKGGETKVKILLCLHDIQPSCNNLRFNKMERTCQRTVRKFFDTWYQGKSSLAPSSFNALPASAGYWMLRLPSLPHHLTDSSDGIVYPVDTLLQTVPSFLLRQTKWFWSATTTVLDRLICKNTVGFFYDVHT